MGLFRKAAAALTGSTGLTNPELMRWATGGETYAGESITADKAMQLDTVFACTRLVAQTIATLPIVLYRRDPEGGIAKPATDHKLYRVLHDRPNASMTAVDYWTASIACKLTWGNAYAEIIRRSDGSVISLEPMRTDRVQIDDQPNGERYYRYTFNGQTTVLPEENVLHLKGLTFDGKDGLSVLSFARQSYATSLSAEKTAGSFFKNMLKPSGYLKIPTFLSPANRQRVRDYLNTFSGAENNGKTPVFEGGIEFSPLMMQPNDAQFLETRSFNIETICRWFGVPPSLVGHTEKSTTWGTGLEQINLGFLQYTLRAHLKEIEQAISHKLLLPSEQELYYAEFNVEGLLRADSKGRSEFYRTMGQSGFMTPNEVRRLENMPPMEGGDHLMVQGAMMPLDVLVEQATQAVAQMMLMGLQAQQQQDAPLLEDQSDDTGDATPDEIEDVSDDELKSLFSPELLAK